MCANWRFLIRCVGLNLMVNLSSERITKRLYWAMLLIMICVLLGSIPLMVSSAYQYIESKQSYYQIGVLSDVADLANKISRERGPANKLMSSTAENFETHRLELDAHRIQVDLQLEKAKKQLHENGFSALALQLEQKLKPSLSKGRQAVDTYAALPYSERNAAKLDSSIVAMYQVWDDCRYILKQMVSQSEIESIKIAHFASQIVLLADLRDQAGRVVSNVTAAVTFGTAVPEQNLIRTLQTQYQVRYLWGLVDTFQLKNDQTDEFRHLHADIEKHFLNEALPIVDQLLQDDAQRRPYHLTGLELTETMGKKFSTVVDLQHYLLEYTHDMAHEEMRNSLHRLIWVFLLLLTSLITAISTMVFARKSIYVPLLNARNMLFDLSQTTANQKNDDRKSNKTSRSYTLFDAIHKLKTMLKEREALEFRLKNLAHLDSLTGLSNRFALEEYTKFLAADPQNFSQMCLMVMDIDYFKRVNDTYGHIVGDQVIQLIADRLKENIRTSDLSVRYGGDEFLLLLENIELDKALEIAEKIRSDIAESSICDDHGQVVQVSVSIGVTVGAENWMDLLEKADQALFRAKAAGRNRVSI